MLRGRLGIAVLLAGLMLPCVEGWSQSGRTVRYPRVYGATGRPYGPTQAHYQYQKQYGRPWHGYGGITAPAGATVSNYVVQDYGAHYQPYGYYGAYDPGYGFSGYDGYYSTPYFSPYPTYTPPVPSVIYGYPPVLGYNPNGNGAIPFGNGNAPSGGLLNDINVNPNVNGPLDATPLPATIPLPPPSSAKAILKSVQAQAHGDSWFQKQEYATALDRYKTAVSLAPDRGEAHLRLAMTYAAVSQFEKAALQLKLGLANDPRLISKVEPLKDIYGAHNAIAQSAMVHRVTLWAKKDIRDPDRLFLLGVLLYLQGDERSPILLETGLALAGGGDHFREFLKAAKTSPLDVTQANAGQPTNPPQTNPQDDSHVPAIPPLPLPPAPTPGDENTLPNGPALPPPGQSP